MATLEATYPYWHSSRQKRATQPTADPAQKMEMLGLWSHSPSPLPAQWQLLGALGLQGTDLTLPLALAPPAPTLALYWAFVSKSF